MTELMDIDPCADLETAREIVAYHLHDTGVRRGVFERQTHLLIGTCGYHCWDEVSAQAEIGYDLSRARWGRGLMREAVEAALAFGFGTMALSVVCAIPERANARSIQLLERLGFECRPGLADPDDSSVITYTLSRPS